MHAVTLREFGEPDVLRFEQLTDPSLPADQHERYERISEHLASCHLPYTAQFVYVSKGILVGCSWYPIVKMEWVDGDLLGAYVERLALGGDRNGLAALAKRWLDLVITLQSNRIGHGDLQHGNVLVAPDGRRSMATDRGASIGLRPEDLLPAWFADVRLIHVPAYSLFVDPLGNATRAAIGLARDAGQGAPPAQMRNRDGGTLRKLPFQNMISAGA